MPGPGSGTRLAWPARGGCGVPLQTQRGTEGARLLSATWLPWVWRYSQPVTPHQHHSPAPAFGHRHAANFAFSSPGCGSGGVQAASAHK